MDCFSLHGRGDLQAKFDQMIKDGVGEKEAARRVILDEHKNLYDTQTAFRKEINPDYKPKDYPDFDNGTEIAAIHRKYDDLIQERRNKVLNVGITSASENDAAADNVHQMFQQAKDLKAAGDQEGASRLYNKILDIGEADLEDRFKNIEGAQVELNRTKGNFYGGEEPTFEAKLHITDDKALEPAFKALAEFAGKYKQSTIHISEDPVAEPPAGEKLGAVKEDGSVYEPNFEIKFDHQLTDEEFDKVSDMIQSIGKNKEGESQLAGATLHHDKKGLTLYNLSKFKDHEQFIQQAAQIEAKLRNDAGIHATSQGGVRRLWVYGDSDFGATRGYEDLRGTNGKEGENLHGQLPPQQQPNTNQQNVNPNAIREPGPSGILPHTQEGTGGQGSERGGVGQGEQGQKTPPPGQTQGEGQVAGGEIPGVGISHEAQKDRAAALAALQPERGEGVSLEESIAHGNQLLAQGHDVEANFKQFQKDKKLSYDDMAAARARYNQLARATDDAALGKGAQSDEYKQAQANERDFFNRVIKPMQTEWHRIGIAQQGYVDLETGSVSSIQRQWQEQNPGGTPTEAQTKSMEEQAAKIKEQNDTIAKLTQQIVDLNEGKTTKGGSTGKGSTKTGPISEAAKKAANWVRKAKTKPFTFKDSSGNEYQVHTAGFTWNDAVEAAAKAIEKTGEIADGVAAAMERFKELPWFNKLGDADREKLRADLTAHFEANRPLSKEEKQIKQLEGKKAKRQEALDKLLAGEYPEEKVPQKLTGKAKDIQDEINDINDQIAKQKDLMGLTPSKAKKPAAEEEPLYNAEEHRAALADKLQGKEKTALLSDAEKKDVYTYVKKNYLLRDNPDIIKAVRGASRDLGISVDQVVQAMSRTSGAAKAMDRALAASAKRNMQVARTKMWLSTGGKNKWLNIPDRLFALAVFGHGTVAPITHAGMDLFDPGKWGLYFKFMKESYQNAYGSFTEKGLAAYEKRMETMTNSPRYEFWKKNGAAIDVEAANTDDYLAALLFGKGLGGKLTAAGTRGFNTLKTYRFEQLENWWSRLSDAEKADPNTPKVMANMVNLSTGTTKVNLGDAQKLASTALFAPKLAISRYQRIFTEPGKAGVTFGRWAASELSGGKIAKPSPSELLQARNVAREVGVKVATYATALAANQAILSMSGSDQKINWDDPSKPDWLNFKIGGKSIGLTGGMVPELRFLASLGHEIGRVHDQNIEKKMASPQDREKDDIWRQLRYKMSPFAQTVTELMTGQDALGNVEPFASIKPTGTHYKLGWKDYIASKLPIPVAEGYKTFAEGLKEGGMKEHEVNNIMDGIFTAVTVGATGARVNPDKQKKKLNAYGN